MERTGRLGARARLVAPLLLLGAVGGIGPRLLAAAADASPAGKVKGRKIAKEALKYKGDKYAWGEESPKKGFDCSGLTWYVFKKVANIDIGRTVPAQWDKGKNVKKSKLKPGDLVFFKNTDGKGLTHVGICLGGGKFIHAENEKTGVVVTPLSSSYYTDHWAGARRI